MPSEPLGARGCAPGAQTELGVWPSQQEGSILGLCVGRPFHLPLFFCVGGFLGNLSEWSHFLSSCSILNVFLPISLGGCHSHLHTFWQKLWVLPLGWLSWAECCAWSQWPKAVCYSEVVTGDSDKQLTRHRHIDHFACAQHDPVRWAGSEK